MRTIAIAFKNNTDYTLENVGVYFESGTCYRNIAYQLPSKTVCMFGARKTENCARGSVGVFSYYIQDVNKTVRVMWSVPYDYNLYSNWWKVNLVDDREEASESVYGHLYNGSGTDGFPKAEQPDKGVKKDIKGFHLLGSMTNRSHATLELELTKA